MADIKTRESLRTVKTFDRVQNLASKTKEGANEAKQGINNSISSAEASENEYASDRLEGYERSAGRLAVHTGERFGKWGARETSRNIRKWLNRPKIPKVEVPKQPSLPSPVKRPMLQAPKIAGKSGSKAVTATTKAAKGTVKTTKSTVKTAKAGVKTGAKTAKATAKTAKTTAKATVRTTKAAVRATAKFIKLAVKAIVAAVKATVAVIKGIVAAIAAGGWIAVLVIVIIVIIGGVIGAVYTIFTPDEEGTYSVSYMISACNSEYNAGELEIINNTPHDYLTIEGERAPDKEVIAVFIVLTDSSYKDFSEMDSELVDEFNKVFYMMNSRASFLIPHEETVVREYTDEKGNIYEVEETVTKTTLSIEYFSISASSAAKLYNFSKKQIEQLNTLLSSDFDEIWAAIGE